MAGESYAEMIQQMKEQGILFLENVTSDQLALAEARYGLVFPEPLRRFYMEGMPVSFGFVNWLEDSVEYVDMIKRRIDAPVKGVLLAVEMEEIWPNSWGVRPAQEEMALAIAGKQLDQAASLIPLYSHRYLVCSEQSEAAPVLSVYGGDIIYYGSDLLNWLQVEFGGLSHKSIFQAPLPEIPGWQDLIG